MNKKAKHNHPFKSVGAAVLLLPILLLSIVLPACSRSKLVYSAFLPISIQEGWQQRDTIAFSPNITSPLHPYQLSLWLRHTNLYPYSDLKLALEVSNRAQGTIYSDTLQLPLTTAQGEWQGGGFGSLYQYELTPPIELTLAADSTLQIKLTHLMGTAPLQQVSEVGITVRSGQPQ